jgi:hypothetical protein
MEMVKPLHLYTLLPQRGHGRADAKSWTSQASSRIKNFQGLVKTPARSFRQ